MAASLVKYFVRSDKSGRGDDQWTQAKTRVVGMVERIARARGKQLEP